MTPPDELYLTEHFLDTMLLHKEGFCCSQIMAILMLRSRGREDPDLVRALGGLCDGIGHIGDSCGVLSGGMCLISLQAGKGSSDETPDPRLPIMYLEFAEWFKARTGGSFDGMKCDHILAGSPDRRICLTLITEAYEKVLSILESRHAQEVEEAEQNG